MSAAIRKELGPYMSAECFRYLRLGAEDTAGRALIVSAGKLRGLSLEDMLKSVPRDDASITAAMNKVLGKEGTRLCIVDAISKTANGYQVRVSESACSSGLQTASPNCAFTLGVFIGAMEVISKQRFIAHETECVATGHDQCVYELEVI